MTISFFDSGVGGLAVMHATRAVLPQYDYYFLGDTAHVPYGNRSETEIYEFTKTAIDQLFGEGAALVVLACNTASAETLRRLQDSYLPEHYPERRLLGVIIPTVEELVASGARRALLIATTHTVNSGKYARELAKLRGTSGTPEIALESVGTPELVPLIERGALVAAVEHIGTMLTRRRGREVPDTLILGCTHYALLTPLLRKRYPGLRILSQDEVIPPKLATYLQRHPEIERHISRTGKVATHFTGPVDAGVLRRLTETTFSVSLG